MKTLIQLIPQEIDRSKARIPGMQIGDYLYCTSTNNRFKGCIMKVIEIKSNKNRVLQLAKIVDARPGANNNQKAKMYLLGTQTAIDKVGYRISKDENIEHFL